MSDDQSVIAALDALAPLREVIDAHGLRAKKSLGQNFLLDQNITDKIVRCGGDLSEIDVIEIGPGPGGLTRSLLRAGAKSVTAIEFDPRAVEALHSLQEASGGRLKIIQADALEADVIALTPQAKRRAVIANLPYNIATPLLIGWLRQLYQEQKNFSFMLLMFQKEVGQRITAKENTKAYGRLAVIAQWLCEAQIVYTLPPHAFTPPPKVDSCVVQLIPRKPRKDWPRFETIESITAAAFGGRRKMIRSSMKAFLPQEWLADERGEKRAEVLAVKDFIDLAKNYENI